MALNTADELKIEDIVERQVTRALKPIEMKIDRVIVVLDKFAGNVNSLQEQLTMVEGQSDKLENHEERIAKIETKVGLSSS